MPALYMERGPGLTQLYATLYLLCTNTYFPAPPLSLHYTSNCSEEDATFNLDIEVWVSMMKDIKVKGSTPASKPVASFKCVFDSPKYKNSAPPVPFANKFVSVSGVLTDIFFNDGNEDGGIQMFLLSVEHIVFMGGGPETVAITNKLDSPASTPRSKGLGARFKLTSSSQLGSPLGTPVSSISSPSTSDMNTNGKWPRIDAKQAGPSAHQLEKMRED